MPDGEYRIFLSAVSSEFRSARNALTDDFGARDVLVRVQEQFVPDRHPHTLLAALDNEMQVEIKNAWPTGGPFTQADVQRVKAIREDYEARKSSLIKKGESELQGYLVLQKDLESVGAECPEAAKTIPD